MLNIKETLNNFKSKYQKHTIINTLIIIAICFFQYISLDLSSIISFRIEKIILLWCVTVFSLFFITMILVLITRKTKLCCMIVSTLVLVLSIINFLVYKYHGTPFTLSDIKNATTAFNSVRDSNILSFIFQPRYLIFIACFLIELFLSNFFDKKHKFKRSKALVLIIFCGIGIYFSYFSANPLVPIDALSSVPEVTICQYSYFPGFVRQIHLSFLEPVNKPFNYNEENTIELLEKYTKEKDYNNISNLPDIVLILNESYFNVDLVKETNYSNDYLNSYHNIDNTIKGYTVVTGNRGGTNISEWELLTSNSYNICNSITPFHDINMDNANSIVSYLKKLGYYTIACHPQSKVNYNRGDVWKKLGFDEVYFEDDLNNLDYFMNLKKNPTDESLYNNIIELMNTNTSNSPKFIFCITMQNHLPFDTNVFKTNPITCNTNFGKNQDEVEEYLSCLQSSDQAFEYLINAFKDRDQDIIISMCGDHAPAIDIFDINSDSLDYYTNIRSTPLIIWSNNENYIRNFYEIPESLEEKRISLIYLVPSILESANIPLSNYYDLLISLRNQMPVIPYGNTYFDSLGNVKITGENNEIDNFLETYYNIEYYNITKPTDFKSHN